MYVFETTLSGERPVGLLTYLESARNKNPQLKTRLIVKINDDIILPGDYSSTYIQPGDKIMLLPLLGGG